MVVVVFAESFCCTYVAEEEIVLQALQDVAQSATLSMINDAENNRFIFVDFFGFVNKSGYVG